MSKSILLHRKLGVNPRIIYIRCHVCGQEKSDSLVLLGRSNYVDVCPDCKTHIYGGARDHSRSYGGNYRCPKCSYTSNNGFERIELSESEHIHMNGICQDCRKMTEQGIVLISVKDGESGDNPYRTGRVAVVKEEAIRNIVHPKELSDTIIQKRV